MSTAGDEPEDTSNGTAEFLATLLPSAAAAAALYGLFTVMRPKLRNIYAPRASWLRRAYVAPKLPASNWIPTVWRTPESYVIENVGMDAAVYLRIFRIAIKLFVASSVFSLAVLITNVLGDGGESGLNSLSMSNIEDGSALMWVHVASMWGISLIAYHLMKQNYREILELSQEYKVTKLRNYSVLVRDLPVNLCNDQALQDHFRSLYPHTFHDASVVRDVGEMDAKVQELVDMLTKRNRKRAEWQDAQQKDANAKRPTMRTGRSWLPCTGEKVDAIEFYDRRANELRVEIEEMRGRGPDLSTAGFVTFKTLADAAAAAQLRHDMSPVHTYAIPAPQPREIEWDGVIMSREKRDTEGRTVTVLMWAVVFLYFFPITFVAGLSDADALSENGALSWLDFVNDLPDAVRGLIQGLLPAVLLAVLISLAPKILRYFARREGAVSESAIQSRVIGTFYAFQVLYVFLFTLLAKSLFKKLSELIGSPGDVLDLLGEAMPEAGNFFMSYVALRALVDFSKEAARLKQLFVVKFKLRKARTEVEHMEALEPGYIDYGKQVPRHMIIFLIVVAYAVLQPLMTLFGLIYFSLGLLVWKHQLLMVYTPITESGGSNWHRYFRFMCIALFVSQLTVLGVVAVKEGAIMGPFLVPLPLITIAFYRHFDKYYGETVKQQLLARNVAVREDESDKAPSGKDLDHMHAALRHPANLYDLDDILYQTTRRAKILGGLQRLPPIEVWRLDNDDAVDDDRDRMEGDEVVAANKEYDDSPVRHAQPRFTMKEHDHPKAETPTNANVGVDNMPPAQRERAMRGAGGGVDHGSDHGSGRSDRSDRSNHSGDRQHENKPAATTGGGRASNEVQL